MRFVFEFDTRFFAEVFPGGDYSGTVAEDVVDVVRPFAAHVAGVGVVWGASWWNIEGFATSRVGGKCIEYESTLGGDEVRGNGVEDVFTVLHEVVSWGLLGVVVGGGVLWCGGC